MPEEMADRTAAAPGEVSRQPRPVAGPAQQGPSGGVDAPRSELRDEEAVSRAEFGKVVRQRQAAKEKARQLETELGQLRARLDDVPHEDELRRFREWNRLREQAGLPMDQQAEDMHAIAHHLRGPLETRIEDLRGRRDALERRLIDLLRDQELRVAAARANAINPEQVIALLRDRVRMAESADGGFAPEFVGADGQPVFDGPQRVTEPQRFVELFLAMPENANLVRPTVTPGSGARRAGGPATSSEPTPRSKAEFLSLPPEERLAVANRMTRAQRDAMLGRGSAEDGGYL